MIQDIAPHQLHKKFKIKKPEKSAFIIYVWDNKILLKGTKEEPRTFLTVADLEAEVSEIYNKAMYLFAIETTKRRFASESNFLAASSPSIMRLASSVSSSG